MKSNSRTVIAKIPLSKLPKGLKHANQSVFVATNSARELKNPMVKNTADCLMITSIPPPKADNINVMVTPIRQVQNFKISSNVTPNNLLRKETSPNLRWNSKDFFSKGKEELSVDNTKKSYIEMKVAELRDKLGRREQEKEKEREEIIRVLQQAQKEKEREREKDKEREKEREKENDKEKEKAKEKEKEKEKEREEPKKQLKSQTTIQPQQTLTEEEKVEALKVVKQQQKEQISEIEERKIGLYFRYKIFSLAKLVEDKIRGMNSGNKNTKGPSKPRAPGVSGLTPFEEVALIDELWRLLKVITSTRSKYKYRDVVNYNKKLRETMKALLPINSPKPTKSANITLNDESPSKPSGKKPKSPDGQKVSACNEFIQRKKENPAAKVFIVTGGYSELRRALEERGWIENPDTSSKDFNLKWTSKVDMNFESLKPHQYVNHFEKNASLTTKVGLARNIRNLIWYENEDIDQFYPRCYDLNDVADFDDFLEDFKFEQAITVLRLGKSKGEGVPPVTYGLFKLKLCIALTLCERKLRPLNLMVYDLVKSENLLFTQEEWELMSTQELESGLLESQKYSKLINSLKKRFGVEFGQEPTPELDEPLFNQAEAALAKLEKEFPQFSMNQGKNVWIVKPAGLSRGRGIGCHNNLLNILDHVKIKESEWVAQKYIENPLIIKNRKFDIRQWVVVTDWNPLTVWFYDECYARFTAQDFNPEDLTNKFAHLTNNAISKNASNFDTSEIEGNMWDSNELRAHLIERAGIDVYEESIKPQMKNIVIKSLQSAPDMIDSRKNSFELYGYDFMIDDNFKTWLLEINCSPCMEYSTGITERLVKQVLADCVKVVVDYGMSKGKSKKTIDTGGFQCIFSGKSN